MMLNDLIDRLEKFRDKHGCIETDFSYGGSIRDKCFLHYDILNVSGKPCLTIVCFEDEDD